MLQLNVAAVVRIEVLVHAAKRDRVAIGFNLQDQLNEVAQLQRLPEGLRRLMGDDVAVFGNRQQLLAACVTGFCRRHLARQRGEAFAVVADRRQHNINRFQELFAVQVFQHRQIDARPAFGDFCTQAVQAFLQQQRVVDRQVGVAGGHIALCLNNAGGEQRFLLIGKHAVAAVLYGLAAPPRAHFMQHALVLFADREAGAGAVGEIVDLFLDPADGVFREDRRGAHFAGLVADDQLIVLDPDGALGKVMRQRQGTTHRDWLIKMLLIHLGVVAGAFGTDRWLDNMHQRHFMGLDAGAEGVEFQSRHKVILVRSPLAPCSAHNPAQRRAAREHPAVYPVRCRAD